MNNMEKITKYKWLLLGIFAIAIQSAIVIYFLEEERKSCSKTVILNTGDTIRAWSVHPYNSGMVEINECDGGTISIPNFRIKEIKEK